LATPAQVVFGGVEVFRWQIIETGIVLKGFTLHAARIASDLFMMGLAVLGLGENAVSFYIASRDITML
jgi:hypothetical protein